MHLALLNFTSPAKPSRPSRAYIHLLNDSLLHPFSDLVRQSNFEDVQNTFTNSCLIGPPVVEFAPYNRVPTGKSRVDARAGTIDQDAEFMAFLEGLANPVTSKEVGVDGEIGAGKQEKVTTTPLVQFLKDKKASRNKEAALKASKKLDPKGKPAVLPTPTEDVKRKITKDVKPERAVERAAKEAVKILNREAAKSTSSSGPSSAGSSSIAQSATATPKLDISKVPIRQRNAVTAAHIRMLQRDLGFSPAQAHRQVKRDAADSQKAERAAAVEKAAIATRDVPTTVAQAPPTSTAPKVNAAHPNSRRSRAKGANEQDANRNSGNASSSRPTASQTAPSGPSTPIILLRKPEAAAPAPTPPALATQPSKPAPVVLARKSQAAPVPSDGATQAFVKHANPSQGVTEALLKEAMEKFGGVSHVEIDRRKGFAYVNFVDTDGLKKAMAANPISVGQGTVQVLQRKGGPPVQDKKPVSQPAQQAPPPTQAPSRQNNLPNRGPPQNGPNRGGRGGGGRGSTIGRRGGRGGGRGGGNGPVIAEGSKAPSSAPTGPAAK